MASESRSLPEKYVCIDVECVATGRRHDARSVALVAIVDQDERVLLKKKVKPIEKIVSYLTPLTGLREGDLDDGEQLYRKCTGGGEACAKSRHCSSWARC